MSSNSRATEQLVEFLMQPAAYPGRPSTVELRETHISWVFLTNTNAFKLKKPVRFDFLDFSTLERRKQACDAELSLNRRFAPQVYLDVLPVVRQADGSFTLGQSPNDSTRAVDWVVKMRRLDEASTLENRLLSVDDNAVGDPAIDNHAKIIAKHLASCLSSQAPLTVRTCDFRDRLVSHVHNNRIVLRDLATSQAETDTNELVHSYQLRFLTTHKELISDRVRDGRVIDGHGDLRPDHIYLNHPPAVIDCIEFNASYRANDIVDELAFLAMECDRLGSPQIGQSLFEEYSRESGDHPCEALIAFYKTYRACVRAKVASLRCLQDDEQPCDTAHSTVRTYLSLASKYLKGLGPRLIVMVGGHMGTGKTTLAQQLAEALGGRVVSSDAIRKAGHSTRDRPEAYGTGRYSLERRLETYRRMVRLAADELERSATVVLDASFTTRAMRKLVQEFAEAEGVALLQVECGCPKETALERISQRAQHGASPSEAHVDLFDKQVDECEPPLVTVPHVQIDTTQAIGEQVRVALELLKAVLHPEVQYEDREHSLRR